MALIILDKFHIIDKNNSILFAKIKVEIISFYKLILKTLF